MAENRSRPWNRAYDEGFTRTFIDPEKRIEEQMQKMWAKLMAPGPIVAKPYAGLTAVLDSPANYSGIKPTGVAWRNAFEGDRIRRPHDCERCGHHMEWDDQECGCTARDPWLSR